MTDTFRAMCAELVAAVDLLCGSGYSPRQPVSRLILTVHVEALDELADRARALLDQPVAEGPTDKEIEEWADACPEAPLEEMDPEVHGWRRCFTAKEFSETIRAALARWGRPTPQPVAVSERLPGPEDCDEQGRCWWFTPKEGNTEPFRCTDWSFYAGWRQKYTHWLPSSALPTPEATND